MSQWSADGYNQWSADGYNGWSADGYQPGMGPPPPPPPKNPAASPYVPPVNTTLQTQINSYLYQQYYDDDDLQAFIAAFNGMAQQYLDDFNNLNLPVYTGLSAPLLQWVADGLYGTEETSLASPVTPATGPLNTVMLNTTMLNSGSPAGETFYSITDDLFKRILTWNLYKGDGKRFSMFWIKRRIARFIFGVNGIDPNPFTNQSHVIGAENTQGISVTVSSNILTVSLNQAILSNQTQLTPGILTLFQLAFLSGQLELPLQYSYAVNITTTIGATVSPIKATSINTGSSQTTPVVSIMVTNGSGSYTYAWSWFSGGTGITINSSTAFQTSFTASGLILGQDVNGLAQCVVTDTVTSETVTVSVPVNIERAMGLTALIAPAVVTAFGGSPSVSSGNVTATAIGGTPGYSYAWSWLTGGVNIGIATPGSATTKFNGINIAPGGNVSGVVQCIVTDNFGQTVTVTAPVTLSRVSLVTGIVSPPLLTAVGATATISTGNCTVSPTGGEGPYTFSWAWRTGGSTTINSPTSATTNFTSHSLAPGAPAQGGTAACTIKDVFGQVAVVTLPVTITRVSAVTSTVSPTSQTTSAALATQTTGVSTMHPVGGSGSYTYDWIWSTGGTGININSIHAAGTSFTASGMTPGTTRSGVAQCTATDGYGQISISTVSVSITYS